MLPYVLEFNAPAIPDGYGRLATALGIEIKTVPQGEWATAVVRHVREMIGRLGLPDRLEAIGMKRADFTKVASHVMNEAALKFNPRKVEGERQVIELLEAAF